MWKIVVLSKHVLKEGKKTGEKGRDWWGEGREGKKKKGKNEVRNSEREGGNEGGKLRGKKREREGEAGEEGGKGVGWFCGISFGKHGLCFLRSFTL